MVTVIEGNHWICGDRINKGGYGYIQWNKKQWMTHRLFYTYFIGEIPDGLIVCHKPPCCRRDCCNPNHLYAGTVKDNAKDRDTVGNTSKFWLGKKMPEEAIKKMSDAKKLIVGEQHPRYGTKHTEETKSKISAAKKGRGNYWSGRNHTEETKKKLSEARRRYYARNS